MLRGINKQIIFKDNEDYEKLLYVLKDYKEICEYEIYAYCFMSNHIHILIKEGKEDLGMVFRRIGAKYVYWYNKKYERCGHLFQGRYKSEPVEHEKYFLTVLRYIHQNPIKAGITNKIEKYPWSSYQEYIWTSDFCNTNFPLSLFSDNRVEALSMFKNFNSQTNDDKCFMSNRPKYIDDKDANVIIKQIVGIVDPKQIQHLDKEKRDEIIKCLKDKGMSIRQIERLTGVSFSIIRRI